MVLGALARAPKIAKGIASLGQKAKNLAIQQKREATIAERVKRSKEYDPEGVKDLENWLRQHENQGKITTATSPRYPYKAPIQETKPVVFNRPVDTTKTSDINWDKVLDKKIDVKGDTDLILKQKGFFPNTDEAEFKILTNQARGLYYKNPENFLTKLKNKDPAI